jgi:hypothetical protein
MLYHFIVEGNWANSVKQYYLRLTQLYMGMFKLQLLLTAVVGHDIHTLNTKWPMFIWTRLLVTGTFKYWNSWHSKYVRNTKSKLGADFSKKNAREVVQINLEQFTFPHAAALNTWTASQYTDISLFERRGGPKVDTKLTMKYHGTS